MLLLPQEPQARTRTLLFSLFSCKQWKVKICPQKPPLQEVTRGALAQPAVPPAASQHLGLLLAPLVLPRHITAWALLPRNHPLALPASVTWLSRSPGKPCKVFFCPLCPCAQHLLSPRCNLKPASVVTNTQILKWGGGGNNKWIDRGFPAPGRGDHSPSRVILQQKSLKAHINYT